jgi:hypothetical protein
MRRSLDGHRTQLMTRSRNPHVPILSPAEFRRRIRPYLPGTVLQLRRLWPGVRRRDYQAGQHFLVGPYCSGCGHKIIWLFRADGTLDCTAEGPWLRRYFQIVRESKTRRLYTFPQPWPPPLSLVRVPSNQRMQPTALSSKERRIARERPSRRG